MNIRRAWAMPNANTFSIRPIRALIQREFDRMSDEAKAIDPFVRHSPFASLCLTNDIDTDIQADSHEDALAFLSRQKSKAFDLVLFDPPYSPRQVSEVYKKMGLSVNMQTTQASFWGDIKSEISRVTKSGGRVITCGWNSGGIGKKYGFTITDILLVAHGGWHNDTIVTVGEKLMEVKG